MKIKEGFLLKEMAGSYVVVPVGAQLVDFQMMVTLNETGAFLWEKLVNETTEEELVAALLGEYDVDEQTAKADVSEFIKTLNKKEILAN